jgi:hypothetical protein
VSFHVGILPAGATIGQVPITRGLGPRVAAPRRRLRRSPGRVSHQALSPDQFAGWLRPNYRLWDIPELEDRPLGSEAAVGRRRPEDIAARASAYLAHDPYGREVIRRRRGRSRR